MEEEEDLGITSPLSGYQRRGEYSSDINTLYSPLAVSSPSLSQITTLQTDQLHYRYDRHHTDPVPSPATANILTATTPKHDPMRPELVPLTGGAALFST